MADDGAALVTGGASGIGRAMVAAFLGAGRPVHVCDVSGEHILSLREAFPAVTATRADVSRPDEVERVFADLQDHYGGLGLLVNNAGIAGPTGPVDAISIEDFDRCIAVDLSGTFYVTRRAVPMLRQAPGAGIINVASTAGLFGYPLRSPYAASKWAMVGLTKTWAMELGPAGIRVNAICPGSVSGPRIDSVIGREAEQRGIQAERVREVYLRQTSMRTFVSAEDVAEMALFLASAAASTISGQVIAIDGHTEGLSNWLG